MLRMVQLVDDLIERVFPRLRRKPQFAYTFAIVVFIAALLTRFGLSRWLQNDMPFLTFFLAVFITALAAGPGPGVMVVAACFVSSWYFYFPGPGWFPLPPQAIVGLASFATISLMIVGIVGLVISLVMFASANRRQTVVERDRHVDRDPYR